MESSWFLVFIPTKEYEEQLNKTNKKDPFNKNIVTFTDTHLSDAKTISATVGNNTNQRKNRSNQLINSSAVKISKNDLNVHKEELTIKSSYLESHLQDALEIMNVSKATYQLTKSENFYLVTFYIEASDVETALICLQGFGIGNKEFTSVSVIPTSIHFDNPEPIDKEGMPQM